MRTVRKEETDEAERGWDQPNPACHSWEGFWTFFREPLEKVANQQYSCPRETSLATVLPLSKASKSQQEPWKCFEQKSGNVPRYNSLHFLETTWTGLRRDRVDAGNSSPGYFGFSADCSGPDKGQQWPGPGPCSCCVTLSMPVCENLTLLSQCPQSAITRHHKGWLKTRELKSLTVVEARSPRLSRGRAVLSLQALGKAPSSPLPSFWHCQQCLVFQSLPLGSHGLLLVCPDVLLPMKVTSHRIRAHPKPL